MAKRLLPDKLWELVGPLLPERSPRLKGGRPPVPDRDALTGVLFVLKTGIPWEQLPHEMGCGCGMTCLRRLREWQRTGVWREIQHVLASNLQEANRIDWSRAVGNSRGTFSKSDRPGRGHHRRESQQPAQADY